MSPMDRLHAAPKRRRQRSRSLFEQGQVGLRDAEQHCRVYLRQVIALSPMMEVRCHRFTSIISCNITKPLAFPPAFEDPLEALPDYGTVVSQQDASAFHFGDCGAVPELQLEHPDPGGNA